MCNNCQCDTACDREMKKFLGGFRSEDGQAPEERYIFVLASADCSLEVDDLDEAKDILQEWADEGIFNPLDFVVYKVPMSSVYEVRQNLEFVKAQE